MGRYTTYNKGLFSYLLIYFAVKTCCDGYNVFVGHPGQRVEGGGRGGDQEGCQAQGRREHVGHSRRKSSGIDCKSGEDPIRLKTPDPTLNRKEKKVIIY